MAAVAHNPSFAKKVGVPQSVGKDFNDADKGKFSKGGDTMKKMDPKMMAMMMAKKRGMGAAPAMAPRMAPRMAKGGSASSRADGVATKGKTKGTMIKMNKGGKAC
jgi:hypothetical protein